MTDWTKNAKGAWVAGNKKLTAERAQASDFIVVKYGEFMHDNIQMAYDYDKPCIFFYENDPETLFNMGFCSTPEQCDQKWPDHANPCLQDVVKAISVNGVLLAVHGIIIDCSKVITSTGDKITAQWIVASGNRLMSRLQAIFDIPVYLYMNTSPLQVYKDDATSKETLYTFLREQNPVAVVDFATVGNDLYPVEAEKPALPYDDGTTYFSYWFYGSNGDGTLNVLYRSTLEGLVFALGYVSHSTPPVDEEETPTPDTNDFLTTSFILNKLYQAALAAARVLLDE